MAAPRVTIALLLPLALFGFLVLLLCFGLRLEIAAGPEAAAG
jgi:hypothetical protein